MITGDIVDRLRSAADCPFSLVEGLAALAAITDATLSTPAAYVYAKEEAAGVNERVNAVSQRVEIDIGILLVVRDVSDAGGFGATADLETLKAYVRRRLIGFQPPAAADVITDVGGVLLKARGGEVRWEMTVATAIQVFDEVE